MIKKKCGKCSILVVPNEDGLGPSTFAFYLVRELIKQWETLKSKPENELTVSQRKFRDKCDGVIPDLQIVFRNCKKANYLRNLFKDGPKSGTVSVEVEEIDNIIRLGKRRGELGFENTLDNLLSYPRLSKIYQKLSFPEGCLGVIDIGVPQVVAAAKNRGIPAVTLFDHAWGKSIQEIFKVFAETERYAEGVTKPSEAVSKAIELVCQHEAMTDIVFLFPTYIAPEEYHKHWRELGVTINELGGVLGGEPYVIDSIRNDRLGSEEKWKEVRENTKNRFGEALKKSLKDQDFTEDIIRTLSPNLSSDAVLDWSDEIRRAIDASKEKYLEETVGNIIEGKADAAFLRAVAKLELLKFKEQFPVVYVSGGGTPVWEELMEKVIKGAIELEEKGHLKFGLVIASANSPDKKKWKELGIEDIVNNDVHIQMDTPIFRGKPSKFIRFVRDIFGGTHQEIFYGTDLIVTRAGGGTANDAIATRTPLVCIEEPGHWQVEAIRKSLVREGFARTVTLESFRNNPLRVIEHELFDNRLDNEKMRRRLDSIKNRAEQGAVKLILEYFLDRESYYSNLAVELTFS